MEYPLLSSLSHEDDLHEEILVLHPKRFRGEPLLVFGARCDSNSNTYTLPTKLVLDAMFILSNHQGELCFLSKSDDPRDHSAVVDNTTQLRLQAGEYYFHVSAEPDYAVILRFDNWTPPERNAIPKHWFVGTSSPEQEPRRIPRKHVQPLRKGSTITVVKEIYNNTCVVSGLLGTTKTVEGAHVIPVAKKSWFEEHDVISKLHYSKLSPYGVTQAIHDVRNILPHHLSPHKGWDTHLFSYYPLQGEFVTIFLSTQHDTMAKHLHLRIAGFKTPLMDPYILFCRFALTVFTRGVGDGLQTLEQTLEVEDDSLPLMQPASPTATHPALLYGYTLLPSLSHTVDNPQVLLVLHPNELFQVPILWFGARRDSPDVVSPHTLPTLLVLDAAFIISNRQGFLSTSSDPNGTQGIINASSQPKLSAGVYFFHVPSEPDYDVTPFFDDWTPPRRDQLPGHWFMGQGPSAPQRGLVPQNLVLEIEGTGGTGGTGTGSKMSAQVKAVYQSTCIISGLQGTTETIQGAHAIPVVKEDWLVKKNVMSQLQYTTTTPRGSKPIHDIRNIFPHHCSPHKGWDTHLFSYYPLQGKWVAIFLSREQDNMANYLHLRIADFRDFTPFVDPYIFFCRFALAIFEMAVGDRAPALAESRERLRVQACQAPGTFDSMPSLSTSQSTIHSNDEDLTEMEEEEDTEMEAEDSELAIGLDGMTKAEMYAMLKAFEDDNREIPPHLAPFFDYNVDRDNEDRMNKMIRSYRQANPNIGAVSGSTV